MSKVNRTRSLTDAMHGHQSHNSWDEFMNIIWHDELSRSQCSGIVIVLIGITTMSLPHTLLFGSQFLKDLVQYDSSCLLNLFMLQAITFSTFHQF